VNNKQQLELPADACISSTHTAMVL